MAEPTDPLARLRAYRARLVERVAEHGRIAESCRRGGAKARFACVAWTASEAAHERDLVTLDELMPEAKEASRG